MKSLLEIAEAVATSPPAFTCAPCPNTTPLGLTSHTCPLAVSDPSIWLGCVSWMRFSAMLDAEGCEKRTASPVPMLKLLQSITARLEDCVTLTLLLPPAIDADPAEPARQREAQGRSQASAPC